MTRPVAIPMANGWTMEDSLACDWCRTRSTIPPKTAIERLTRQRGELSWPKE